MSTVQVFTQSQKVSKYLRAGKSLTAREAISRFKIKNLRARIFELRQGGMNISTIPYVRRDGVSAVKYVFKSKSTRRWH